jgi:hypothetical protein
MKSLFALSLMLLAACASMADNETPPALENRTLRISEGAPGLEYQWRECVRKGLFGGCREWATRKELYDLTVPEVRAKLINMGFVARVREKALP